MQDKENLDSKRTTVEQLQFFVDFLNIHPELVANKNNPTDPAKVQNLWSDLAASLNALNGPTRSAKKWKETLSHWKNQLRSRARKIKLHRTVTGGGPPSKMKLKEYEERAIEAFGEMAVNGIPGVPTLGSPTENEENQGADTTPKPSLECSEPEEFLEAEFLDSYLDREPAQEEEDNVPAGFPSAIKITKKTSTNDTLNQIIQMMKAREEREEKRHEDNVRVQQSIANSLFAIAESMQSLRESFANFSKSS